MKERKFYTTLEFIVILFMSEKLFNLNAIYSKNFRCVKINCFYFKLKKVCI